MKHSTRIVSATWHLLLCKPNQNHIAFRNLKALGFDLFMPRHRVNRRWRGRVREELRPVFAGYMFVATDPDRPRWQEARNTPGVSQLVRFNKDAPATVPTEVVAGLMSRCNEEGLLEPVADDLSVGDTVRVISGPFHEFVASVEEIAPDRRLHLLLNLLGRQTRVQLDPSMVMRSSPI